MRVLTLPATERGLKGLNGFIGRVSRDCAASRQCERSSLVSVAMQLKDGRNDARRDCRNALARVFDHLQGCLEAFTTPTPISSRPRIPSKTPRIFTCHTVRATHIELGMNCQVSSCFSVWRMWKSRVRQPRNIMTCSPQASVNTSNYWFFGCVEKVLAAGKIQRRR